MHFFKNCQKIMYCMAMASTLTHAMSLQIVTNDGQSKTLTAEQLSGSQTVQDLFKVSESNGSAQKVILVPATAQAFTSYLQFTRAVSQKTETGALAVDNLTLQKFMALLSLNTVLRNAAVSQALAAWFRKQYLTRDQVEQYYRDPERYYNQFVAAGMTKDLDSALAQSLAADLLAQITTRSHGILNTYKKNSYVHDPRCVYVKQNDNDFSLVYENGPTISLSNKLSKDIQEAGYDCEHQNVIFLYFTDCTGAVYNGKTGRQLRLFEKHELKKKSRCSIEVPGYYSETMDTWVMDFSDLVEQLCLEDIYFFENIAWSKAKGIAANGGHPVFNSHYTQLPPLVQKLVKPYISWEIITKQRTCSFCPIM